MEQDLLEYILFGSGQAGSEESQCGWKNWAGTEDSPKSGRLLLADFYRSEVSFSQVDRELKSLEQSPIDVSPDFSLDIPFSHEVILSNGPEFAEPFRALPNALPDFFHCASVADWSQDYVAVLEGGMGVADPLVPVDKFATLPHVVDEDEDFLLDQLRVLLGTEGTFPPPIHIESQQLTEMRATSVGSDSLYSSAASPVCSPESYPSPMEYTAPEPTKILSPKPKPEVQLIRSTRRPSDRILKPALVKKTLPTPLAAPPTLRSYTRKVSAATPSSPSLSVSSSTGSSMAKRGEGNKVTPKKRTQNRKAAGDYRQRKKLIEEEKVAEHEELLKLRDDLKEEHDSLAQELKFAVKMAEARLKRMG